MSLSLCVILVCLAAPDNNLEPLIDAIAQIESGGNPSAVGDNGLAVGLLQIHPITVRDCNRILGKEIYGLDDRLDPAKSREMFRVIANHYSRGQSYEVIARRWNGGPNGEKKLSTLKYWDRVKKQLEKD